MSLTPMQEEFFRAFFKRQREIGQKALDNVTLLAQTNIEAILESGLNSPNTIEKMEETLANLKREKDKQAATIKVLKEGLDELHAEG